MTDSLVRILTVCTGNVCRSPLAERLLQTGLDRINPHHYSVLSAGTGALVGHRPPQQVEDIAAHFGDTVQDHTARQLDRQTLDNPDLILTMDRGHRTRLLEDFPEMFARTFTLREFSRILPRVTVTQTHTSTRERWAKIVEQAQLKRFRISRPDEDDIADPFRQSNEIYRLMASQLVPPVVSILNWETRVVSTGF